MFAYDVMKQQPNHLEAEAVLWGLDSTIHINKDQIVVRILRTAAAQAWSVVYKPRTSRTALARLAQHMVTTSHIGGVWLAHKHSRPKTARLKRHRQSTYTNLSSN